MITRLKSILPILLTILAFFSVALVSNSAFALKKVDPTLKKALAKAVADAKSFDDEFEAQVWLVDMSARLKRYIKDPQERLTLLRMVHQEATRADLSPELVISVIHVESAFNAYAVSYVGAQGLMQEKRVRS
jgi:soluble lytic murein transglycosylase-like protein